MSRGRIRERALVCDTSGVCTSGIRRPDTGNRKPATGRARLVSVILFILLTGVVAAHAADLQLKTAVAFDRYVKAVETRLEKEVKSGPFLYLDSLPADKQKEEYERVRRGDVLMEKITHEGDLKAEVPDGLIHHWVGVAFIPKHTLAQVLSVMQDYDRHAEIYKPDVLRSKTLSHTGNDFKIYYRLFKKKVISVQLDTEHAAHFVPLGPTRLYSWSHSTKIAEVQDPDTPNAKEKPVGHDSGFLWRLNSYWRLEQKDGGVYVQCEAVSLTRDIPYGVKWLVAPFVTTIPRESLMNTMNATKAAVNKMPAK
jgi:hypothetical protein